MQNKYSSWTTKQGYKKKEIEKCLGGTNTRIRASMRFAESGARNGCQSATFLQAARSTAMTLAETSGALRAFVAAWLFATPASA
jgi:hypothetical protein